MRCGVLDLFPTAHTHMLRQPLSEWQVMGQVLSRHMGGGGGEEVGRGRGPVVSYKSVCDMSRHAEGNQMCSNVLTGSKLNRR